MIDAQGTKSVQIRIKGELRTEAEKVLNGIGLNLSDGIRLFLQQVINSQGLPFQPTIKRPDVEAELKRLQRIIKYDQDFAAMKAGHYTEG